MARDGDSPLPRRSIPKQYESMVLVCELPTTSCRAAWPPAETCGGPRARGQPHDHHRQGPCCGVPGDSGHASRARTLQEEQLPVSIFCSGLTEGTTTRESFQALPHEKYNHLSVPPGSGLCPRSKAEWAPEWEPGFGAHSRKRYLTQPPIDPRHHLPKIEVAWWRRPSANWLVSCSEPQCVRALLLWAGTA